MNATRRSAEPAAGRPGSDAAIRGALLIAVAVVIGLLLLWRGHDSDSTATVTTDGDTPTVTNPDDPVTTNPDGTPGTDPPADTSVAPPPTHAPSEVKVLVANGTGTSGGAGAVTQKLIPLAFATLPAADASSSDIASSVVYYREGFQEDARQIAIHLGVAAETAGSIVQPMPAEPPVQGNRGQESARNAHVLVVLGNDGVIPQA